MKRVALSICLLAFSAYIWPLLYKHSSIDSSFPVVVLIGFGSVAWLCWLSLKIDAPSNSQPNPKQIGWFAFCSIPVVALQIAFAVTYWASVGGAQLHLGVLSTIPGALLFAWGVADAGIRGISEELVFRGFLQPALMSRYKTHAGGPAIAVVVTTFWFLVAHLYGLADYRLLPYFALLSVCYGYLAFKTRRFIGPAILHVMHNAAAIYLAYSQPQWSGVGAPELLGGSNSRGLFWLLVLAVANVIALRFLAQQWAKHNPIPSFGHAP